MPMVSRFPMLSDKDWLRQELMHCTMSEIADGLGCSTALVNKAVKHLGLNGIRLSESIACQWCGNEFLRTNHSQTYCSDDCRKARDRNKARGYYWADEDRRRMLIARSAERARRLTAEGDAHFREQRTRLQREAYNNNPSRRQNFINHKMARERDLPSPDAETAAYMEIVRRDPCSYCDDGGGTMDHIEPVIAGGAHHWENMTGACRSCNSSKRERQDLLVWMLERKQRKRSSP